MTSKDIPEVIQVHLAAFEGFFLTFLGPRFLRELYSAIQSDPSGISFVAEIDDNLCGFVAGTDRPGGFYRHLLLRRWWRFAVASIMPVLYQPSIIPRLLRAFNLPNEADKLVECGTLMSLAVLPDMNGKGLGSALVSAFLDEAARRNLQKVNLTTDKLNNDAANHFYQKLGFKCIRSYITPEGREMVEYQIDLKSFVK